MAIVVLDANKPPAEGLVEVVVMLGPLKMLVALEGASFGSNMLLEGAGFE